MFVLLSLLRLEKTCCQCFICLENDKNGFFSVEGRGPLTFRVFDWLLHWFKAVLFKSWVEVEGN